MAAGVDRRILWITSSDNLRTQTQEEARLFGLDLQSRDFGTNFKHGYQGGVTTYHFVANNPALIRKLVSVAPTIIVFDEIHHCGDESHFGRCIREACELAREKLCMSGTPWKTDGQPIPFVSYDGDGFAVGNYRYDYPDALTDAVVRYLRFDHAKGTIVNEITGSQVEVSGDITEEEAEKRLSILLESDGRYVEQQILDAHAKLTELRQRIPDAGALAICIDQSHARRVAAKIYKLTGSQPSIIVSDEEITNDEVGSFRKSTKEWLVAVRKVSEGTDIKRLMVLCYLTNVTTHLSFRQIIGRVSRVRGEDDPEGYVFLPADPRLIEAASRINEAQVQALKSDVERQEREIEQELRNEGPAFTYTTTHDGTETVLIGTEKVPLKEAMEIERLATLTQIPQQKVRQLRMLMMSGLTVNAVAEPEVETRESYEMKLRKECHRLAFSLSRILDVDVRKIHGQYPPQGTMSIEQLKQKRMKLLTEIRSRERN